MRTDLLDRPPRRLGRAVVAYDKAVDWRFRQHTNGSWTAPIAGNCSSPVTRCVVGLPSAVMANPMGDSPTNVDIEVRCRQCPACLKARAAHWRYRAQAEIASASRTWFGTLTLSPEAQFRCISEARAKTRARRAEDWDKLQVASPADAWRYQLKPLVHEWQCFIKRLRKQVGGLRYMLVVERHKSGLPHLHCLIHETCSPIRHRVLTEKWKWGFSSFKLVAGEDEKRAAAYVCKYLTKAVTGKVVASGGYGFPDNSPIATVSTETSEKSECDRNDPIAGTDANPAPAPAID